VAERRARVTVDLRLERREGDATRVGENGQRMEHVGRLVSLATERLRGEIGAVRLREDPVGRNDRCRIPERRGLRVRHVPCEGHVVPALGSSLQETRSRKAVQDDRAGERRQHCGRVGVGVARVDHDRQPGCRGNLELSLEERTLHLAGSAVMKVVEADLANRDGGRMFEKFG